MRNSQKLENLLNLALDTGEEEREKSQILNVGYNENDGKWELIVRYHGSADAMRSMPGTQVEALLGGYAIVWTPQEQIEALAALEEAEYIEKPKQLLFEVETGKSVSCIDSLQRDLPPAFFPEAAEQGAAKGTAAMSGNARMDAAQRNGLASGGEDNALSGRGVLVGILDSGIDYTLPDFRWADGSSRIVGLWDQTLSQAFTKEQIDEALAAPNREERERLVPSRDLSGHGTAVAGIAAGSGQAADSSDARKIPRYRGVAPASELLVVKLGTPGERSFPRTTQLMRGLDYILREALARNRPVAVNISIGNNYGSHDGTSLLETFIDEAAGFSPNCIVIGSGNEGAAAGHSAGILEAPAAGADRSQIVELSVGVYETSLSIQLWKSYADSFGVELAAPDGTRIGPFRLGQGPQRYRLGGAEVLVYYGEPKPYSRSQEILLDFLPRGTYLDSGVWKFRLIPERIVDGRYDFWLPGASVLNRGTQFLKRTPEVTLTIPSTAARAITVGAYDARRDTYADFSGRGYLRNLNLVKPELAAPGVDVTAPVVGGGYRAQTGTSFAAPFVTGSAALLMEWGMVRGKDPYLYGEKVKAYLIRGARQLGGGGMKFPNNQVGYGALCVENSLPG